MIIYAEEFTRFCGNDKCVYSGRACDCEFCKYYEESKEDGVCDHSYEFKTRTFYDAKSLIVADAFVNIDGRECKKDTICKLGILSGGRILNLIEEGQDV